MSSLTPPADAELVRAARGGCATAWQTLLDRHEGRIAAVCRIHRLSSADAADVQQTTWLRAVEQLDRLRNPERVGAWLATVARNECLRVTGHAARVHPCDDDVLHRRPDLTAVLDSRLLESERADAVRSAVTSLSGRDRALLTLLYREDEPSYAEIGRSMEMPIGSIGPTHGRVLERLRRDRGLAGLAAAA